MTTHLFAAHVRTACGETVEHLALRSRYPLRMYKPLGDVCTGCTVEGVAVGAWHGQPVGEICRVVAVTDDAAPTETPVERPRGRVKVVHGDFDMDEPSDGQGTLF